MGNEITKSYVLVKTDFETDPIWHEHFNPIKYPEKDDWVKLIKERSRIDETSYSYILRIPKRVHDFYYYVDDRDLAVRQKIKEDICHSEKLVDFLFRECYRLTWDVPQHLANSQVTLHDDLNITVTVKDLFQTVSYIKIYNEAATAFESHLQLSKDQPLQE